MSSFGGKAPKEGELGMDLGEPLSQLSYWLPCSTSQSSAGRLSPDADTKSVADSRELEEARRESPFDEISNRSSECSGSRRDLGRVGGKAERNSEGNEGERGSGVRGSIGTIGGKMLGGGS